MTTRARWHLAVAVGVLVLGTAACGDGDADSEATAAPVVVTPSAPYPCTATAGLALPDGWPGDVPVPAGLVITRTERRSGDRLIATGRVPGDFHDVVTFFNDKLPATGFTQKNGELDPRDAESDFTGTTTQGRWTTGVSNDCPGNSEVSMLVLPAGSTLGEDDDKDKDQDKD